VLVWVGVGVGEGGEGEGGGGREGGHLEALPRPPGYP